MDLLLGDFDVVTIITLGEAVAKEVICAIVCSLMLCSLSWLLVRLGYFDNVYGFWAP